MECKLKSESLLEFCNGSTDIPVVDWIMHPCKVPHLLFSTELHYCPR